MKENLDHFVYTCMEISPDFWSIRKLGKFDYTMCHGQLVNHYPNSKVLVAVLSESSRHSVQLKHNTMPNYDYGVAHQWSI